MVYSHELNAKHMQTMTMLTCWYKAGIHMFPGEVTRETTHLIKSITLFSLIYKNSHSEKED